MDILHFQPGAIICLVSAVIIGAAIGFDREAHGHPAGVRTHMLVCLGACLIATIDHVHAGNGGRIAAQVVTGIGLLGAGTIIRSARGQNIHGLTTAASVWTTAGIGIALGFGYPSYNFAVASAILVLITLRCVRTLLEHTAHRYSGRAELTVLVAAQDETISEAVKSVVDMLIQCGPKVHDMSANTTIDGSSHQVVHFDLVFPKRC